MLPAADRAAPRIATDWIARAVAAPRRRRAATSRRCSRGMPAIRTWTYITHHGGWVDDAAAWQERTRGHRGPPQRRAPRASWCSASSTRAARRRGRRARRAGGGGGDGAGAPTACGRRRTRGAGGAAPSCCARTCHVAGAYRRTRPEHEDECGSNDLSRPPRPLRAGRRAHPRRRRTTRATGTRRGPASPRGHDRRGAPGWAPAPGCASHAGCWRGPRSGRRLLAPLHAGHGEHAGTLSPAARGIIYQLEQGLGTMRRAGSGAAARARRRGPRRARKQGVRVGRHVVFVPALLRVDAIAARVALCNAQLGPGRGLAARGRAAVAGHRRGSVALESIPRSATRRSARARSAPISSTAWPARLSAGARPGDIASRLGCRAAAIPSVRDALTGGRDPRASDRARRYG